RRSGGLRRYRVGIAERGRHDVRVLTIRSRDDREEEGEVVDAARQRTELLEPADDPRERRPVTGPRDAALRRLEAGDPADVRRLTDAVARVAADVERHTAGGDDRGGATRRPARRPGE